MDERLRAKFDEHAQPASAANERLSFREAGELSPSNHELALELDNSALDLRTSSRSAGRLFSTVHTHQEHRERESTQRAVLRGQPYRPEDSADDDAR